MGQRKKVVMMKVERDIAPYVNTWQAEANRILGSDGSVSDKLAQLNRLESLIGEAIAGSTACAKGCSNCCYERTDISAIEARMIGAAIGIEPAAIGADYSAPEIGEYGRHTPCPFLAGSECSIYEVRPFVCRSINNLDVDSLLCSFEHHELSQAGDPRASKVPRLRSFLLPAYALLKDQQVVADIRDFFPSVFANQNAGAAQ